MDNLKRIISDHPFFRDLAPVHLTTIVGCAKNVVFHANDVIFREGERADQFYLIKHGRVALEVHRPHMGSLMIETIEEGNVLGWSWLFPPYRWHFDARALSLIRAISLDATCLQSKAEEDFELGYNMMKRFGQVMQNRLQATRLQLLDIYKNPAETE